MSVDAPSLPGPADAVEIVATSFCTEHGAALYAGGRYAEGTCLEHTLEALAVHQEALALLPALLAATAPYASACPCTTPCQHHACHLARLVQKMTAVMPRPAVVAGQNEVGDE